jgi:MYXO-CTERM domain-containing protein
MQFDDAKLDIVNADQPSRPYVQWMFEDAAVSAYNTVFDAGQSLELLAIDFRRITYQYTPGDEFARTTGFRYDRYTNTFEWIGAPPANFVLLTQFTEASTPEPAGVVLAAIGAAAAFGRRRRRGSASRAIAPRP